jgi:hypothetical protein
MRGFPLLLAADSHGLPVSAANVAVNGERIGNHSHSVLRCPFRRRGKLAKMSLVAGSPNYETKGLFA